MRQSAVKTDSLLLGNGDQEWLKAKWAMIREYHTTADAAVNKWRRIIAEINDYLDRKGVTDIAERARYMTQSVPLRDALDTATWHRNEATAHIADVNLYLRLKELGLL